MNIDWESNSSHLCLNPRMPEQEKLNLSQLPELPAHLWITTSGREKVKYVALSKQALLTSAESVNRHLRISENDVWLHVLPDFHVGGIGIWARSFLSGAQVVQLPKWDPFVFIEKATEHKATLASLVPAHVFDLVKENLIAPASFRAIVVGGGALSEDLRERGQALHWPLAVSYGMTECASQVATSHPNESSLSILSHVQIRIDEHHISLKSPSLCTGYAIQKEGRVEFIDPKQEGWLVTEDHGELKEGKLIVWGRNSDFIKIGGENVNLVKLNHILADVMMSLGYPHDAAIIAIADERLGKTIQLLTVAESGRLTEEFNNRVYPFEKIRSVRFVKNIPRTPLQKMKIVS